MKATNSANTSKLDQIMANARSNRRQARKVNLTALSPEEEDRLKSESVTEGQTALLNKIGVSHDSRPLSEGGTLSRWNAMHLIDETLRETRERREIARAKPASDKQIEALLKFGCNTHEIEDLNAGEASDLIRSFAREIQSRTNGQGRKRA